MKPKHLTFAGGAERYRLQLRLVTSESRQQTLWDRSGAGRKFALRAALMERPPSPVGRGPNATRH